MRSERDKRSRARWAADSARLDKAIQKKLRTHDAYKSAAQNPRFPCPLCGATVRRGAGGGLFDIKKRTLHDSVCAAVVAPKESEAGALAKLSKIEKPLTGANSSCTDCGKIEAHCNC